jgi:hypothetical protein
MNDCVVHLTPPKVPQGEPATTKVVAPANKEGKIK